MGRFRPVAIVNPHSSNGRTGRLWPEVRAQIVQKLGALDERMTAFPGQATDLTRECLAAGYDLILSVGGDGTHHEVTNGFFDGNTPINPNAALAVITSGTGGDFRKTLGLGPGPQSALVQLEGDFVTPVDIGRFSYRAHDGSPQTSYFLNILSFGIGGLVDHHVNNTTKALGGRASFFMGTMRAMFQFRPQRVRLTLDGQPPMVRTIHMVALANGRYFGGGMFVAPTAELDDGMFECVVMKDLTTAKFVGMSRHIYKGTHLAHPNVEHYRAKLIEAEPLVSDPVLLDVDGEPKGALPLRVEVVSRAINLKCRAPTL